MQQLEWLVELAEVLADVAAEILVEVLAKIAGGTELEARVEIRQLKARVEIQQLEELEALLVAVCC